MVIPSPCHVKRSKFILSSAFIDIAINTPIPNIAGIPLFFLRRLFLVHLYAKVILS
jgi:hypothetical protein